MTAMLQLPSNLAARVTSIKHFYASLEMPGSLKDHRKVGLCTKMTPQFDYFFEKQPPVALSGLCLFVSCRQQCQITPVTFQPTWITI